MINDIPIRLISQGDVIKLFKNNTDVLFSIVEDSFIKYSKGNVILPDKISQVFDNQTQNRINCMPATLLGEDRVSGMKWVSVFPSNYKIGLQNVTGIMILSDGETGFPLAVIDGTFSTKIRTAAVGCVASRYLAPSKVETVGIIGSGEEAKMHYALLKHMYPSIRECRVSSRRAESEQCFIDTFKSITTDVKFIKCANDAHRCASGADIIVTAISGQSPILKGDDITKGGLYIHVGGWEDDYSVANKADKIVCDDWNATKHRTQTICRMYNKGLLSDDDIYADLCDLITGKKEGRIDDSEFIYFNSVGLSFIDLALSNYIYRNSIIRGLGTEYYLASSNDGLGYENLI